MTGPSPLPHPPGSWSPPWTGGAVPPPGPPPLPPPPLELLRTSHILHLLLSIVTAGLWVFAWAFLAITNDNENRRRRKAHAAAVEAHRQAHWAWTMHVRDWEAQRYGH